MLGFLLFLILWGFVVGALGRLAVPGPDPMPWWQTILIGLGGSLIGGFVARVFLGYGGGIIFSVLGAMLLVILYRRFFQGRGISGPATGRPRRRWP